MRTIYAVLALSLTTASLSAQSAPTNIERYRIVSSNYQDQGHYILVTKYKSKAEERVRFDFCQSELKKCNAIGPQASYSVSELKKRIERAHHGLENSAEQAQATMVVSGGAAMLSMNVFVTLGAAGIARGIYELNAYPGDHYKRQVLDTRDLVDQKRRSVSSLAETVADLNALLRIQEKYLPSESIEVPPPPAYSYGQGGYGQVHLQR